MKRGLFLLTLVVGLLGILTISSAACENPDPTFTPIPPTARPTATPMIERNEGQVAILPTNTPTPIPASTLIPATPTLTIPTDTPSPVPATSTPTAIPPTRVPIFTSITFLDMGDSVTNRFFLNSGLYCVSTRVEKNADATFGSPLPTNFIVTLLSVSGTFPEIIANEISGNYNGERAVYIPEGNYLFEVDAVGEWEINIDSCIRNQNLASRFVPMDFMGIGTEVSEAFYLPSGLYCISTTVQDNKDTSFGNAFPTNFIVQAFSVSQGLSDIIVNDIVTNYTGKSTISVGGFLFYPESFYVFAVDAEGVWEISIDLC